MRPSEVHALPEIRRERWDDMHSRSIRKIFGIDLHDALEPRAGDPLVEAVERLSCPAGDGWCTVSTIEIDGRLIGVLSTGGEREHEEFYLVDRAAQDDAFRYLRSRIPLEVHGIIDATEDVDIPEMTAFHGAVPIEVDGAVRLVQQRDIDRDGRLIFDSRAYDRAFDEIIRPAFPGGSNAIGFADPRMRDLAADAMLAAIPEGLRVARIAETEKDKERPDWMGVVVASDEGTYVFGISSWSLSASHFSWSRMRMVRRLGGPEAFDGMVQEHGPVDAPSP